MPFVLLLLGHLVPRLRLYEPAEEVRGAHWVACEGVYRRRPVVLPLCPTSRDHPGANRAPVADLKAGVVLEVLKGNPPSSVRPSSFRGFLLKPFTFTRTRAMG
jgi:hypothetical protein